MASSSLRLGISWSFIAAAALLACGGGAPAPATPAGTEPGASPAAEADNGADLKWDDSLPAKDKAIFMKKKVMPVMSKSFNEFDPKEYASIGCKTCHGPQMKPHPVDFLPELHIKGGKMAEAEEHPELAKFMHEKVVPQMAELFGKPVYDPATKSGFGCAGCHKMDIQP